MKHNKLSRMTSVLPSSCLNCSQWQTRTLTPPSKQKPASTKLPACSNNHLCTLPLFRIQSRVPDVQLPESIWRYYSSVYEANNKVFLILLQEGCCGHFRGAGKLHCWFAGWEVNRVVIYDGINTQIWRQCGEHEDLWMFFRLQLVPCWNNAMK